MIILMGVRWNARKRNETNYLNKQQCTEVYTVRTPSRGDEDGPAHLLIIV